MMLSKLLLKLGKNFKWCQTETEPCGSCKTVFGTTELLENILSFLDIQDLLQARNVSDQWRSAAEWSLKRRLYAITEQRQRWNGFNISLWEESETFFYLDLCKRELERYVPIPSSVPPLPIPADLHEEVYLQIGPAPTWRTGKSKRYPVVLSTLLKFDWCAGIQHLTLSGRTVSIREWNLIGRYLLSCFRRLKNLDLVLWSADEESNGEWKDFEVCKTSEVPFQSEIKEMDIRYVQLDHNSPRKSQLKLDFLDVCPKLHTLYVRFATEAKEINGSECLLSCKFFEVEGASGRQVDCGTQINASPEAIEAWMNELDYHFTLLKPSSISFNTNQYDYVARLPEVAAARLQRLKFRLNQDTDETANGGSLLKSLSRIPALNLVTNLDLSTSTFPCRNAANCTLLDEILSRSGISENALSAVTTLNLEFLDSDCFCRRPEGRRGKYNTELWNAVPKAMPNIELLFVHVQCLCFLERICHFEKLKHLVILNPDIWTYRMPDPPEAGVMNKLKSLQSISARFYVWDDTTIKQRNLLAAMAEAPSLKVIRVFHRFRVPVTMTEEALLEDLRSFLPRNMMVEVHLMEEIKPNKITLETLNSLVHNLPASAQLEVQN